MADHSRAFKIRFTCGAAPLIPDLPLRLGRRLNLKASSVNFVILKLVVFIRPTLGVFDVTVTTP